MKLAQRAEAALAVAIPAAVADLKALLILATPELPTDAGLGDHWERASAVCRHGALMRRRHLTVQYVWTRMFLWHGAYLYSWLYSLFGGRKAGQWFRSRIVQHELRCRVVRYTQEICG